jgi:N-acetylmuramoyl-L-alanine amidase
MMLKRTFAGLLALLAASCAELPQRSTLPVEQVPSANFNERRPSFVIFHHTGERTVERALSVLTDPFKGVSAHYLIGRDGKIYHLVDELARAWHAGDAYWGGVRDLNSASIGIELDNSGGEPFPEPQIEALLGLLADLKERYKIPTANFLGHGDVAPWRKVDPSVWFPWRRLAEHGFGLWCDPPNPDVPDGVDDMLLLQAFGYSVWQIDAAVEAFKRHFVPHHPWPLMTTHDRGILYCLVQKRRDFAGYGR